MLIDKQNLLWTSDITAGVVKVNLPDIACFIASVNFANNCDSLSA